MGCRWVTSSASMDAMSAHTSTLSTTGAPAFRLLGLVLGKDPLGCMIRLRLHVPGWVKARPGQFVLLQAEDSACFLARALSVSAQSAETVSFLVSPVGRGTRELCELANGSPVWVLGPLGNGFDLRELLGGAGRLLVVGGGVGIAPFPLLLAEMAEAATSTGAAGPEVLVLAGYRDQDQACGGETLAEAAEGASACGLKCSYERVLEDGSEGDAVRVTDLLGRRLRPGDRVVACGPQSMSEAVWRLCAGMPDIKVWFSLETNMACGVGSCHGCVVALADGSYARVCREGPVFAGEEVFGG